MPQQHNVTDVVNAGHYKPPSRKKSYPTPSPAALSKAFQASPDLPTKPQKTVLAFTSQPGPRFGKTAFYIKRIRLASPNTLFPDGRRHAAQSYAATPPHDIAAVVVTV